MTMADHKPAAAGNGSNPSPITEADLHAYVDRQISPARLALVERFLAVHPEERARTRDWQQQNEMMRGLLNPVLSEPVPLGLPLKPTVVLWPWRGLAAGVLIAVVSASSAWSLRGALDADAARLAFANPSTAHFGTAAAKESELSGFAQRAAIAHVVYSPDMRRPVEVGADQEQALVTWLTKRMGTAVRPPSLASLGYELIGGRLLPGEKGPVAQFMYGAPGGQRLTLYVTREVAGQDTSFKYGKDGPVNVFYWVEDHFGYAISAGADRDELMKVSQEVYRQLKPR
ncbi:MAG TPA: anti-sigma factor [Caldimonas sp.]|jgi:anti-sigma factor RsiW